MNHLKKALCAGAMAGLMLLSACGGAPGGAESTKGALQPAEKGRYVEKDITPVTGQNWMRLFQKPDGTLVSFNDDWTLRYESSDGGDSWTESPGPGATEPRFATAWNVTMLEDGSLLADVPKTEGESASELLLAGVDGSVKPFSLPELDKLAADGEDVLIYTIKALPQNRLLLNYAWGMESAMTADAGVADPAESGVESGVETPATDESGAPEAAQEQAPSEAAGAEPTEETPPEETPQEDAPESTSEVEGGFEMNTAPGRQKTALYDIATGEVLADLNEEMPMSAASDGKNAYLLGYDYKLTARALADGKPVDNVRGAFGGGDDFSMQSAMQADADGNLYYCDGKLLQRKAADSEIAETLIDGSGYSFGAPDTAVTDMALLADGAIAMALGGSGDSRIVKYSWDENAEVDPAKTLNIWALRDNPVVRAAISNFRKSNPEATINLEVALGRDSALEAEDAIRTLNTRLLAGEGPDLMVLDGCPLDSYIAQGTLADLSALVEAGSLYEPLRAPYQSEAGTFALPMRWQPTVLAATQEYLDKADSLDALVALAKEGPVLPGGDDAFSALPENERPVMAFGDLDELFSLMWNTGAAALMQDGKVDEEALARFYNSMKELSDHYRLTEPTAGQMGAMAMSTDGASMTTIKGGMLAYSTGRALYGPFTAEDAQVLFFMSEAPDTRLKLFPGLAPGSWVPASLMGINSQSDKQELAAQFLNEMLGDDAQSMRVGGGLPVTPGGLEKQMADIRKTMEDMAEDRADMARQLETEIDFAPLLDELQQPAPDDALLRQRVEEAALAVCNGEKDTATAVQDTVKALESYLAERQ